MGKKAEKLTQSDKFKAMAKDVGADGEESAFDEALKKMAKHILPKKS